SESLNSSLAAVAVSDRVRIRTRDEHLIDSGEVFHTRGGIGTPPLPQDELRAKFLDCVNGVAWADGAALFDSLTHLDALGDVSWRAGLEERAVRHTLGCLLARVCGRSPLEYLTPEQREAQRVAVLVLMAAPPASVFELIDLFLERM
ncbi:MAG TPA: hypothetical protein PKZ61_18995, partial [Thermoflexales bacterium]|nr:hypothetical protein [Thermoflexales bacterium]